MPPSEIRKDAREALSGKWGKSVLIILAYILIPFALGFIEGFFQEIPAVVLLIELVALVITIPVSFGLIISFMKLKRDEEVKAFDFLKDGFTYFGKSWGIAWQTFIRMLLPIICVIVIAMLMGILAVFNATTNSGSIFTILGIILYIATLIYVVSRALLYSLSYYIGYDNPELTSKECVLKSAELMKGNRGNIFLLELSFIGWAILACLTLGIGMLWLMPYMQMSFVCFYEKVAKTEA